MCRMKSILGFYVIKDRVEIKESVHEDGTKLGPTHGVSS
jgi:hypothetical protein